MDHQIGKPSHVYTWEWVAVFGVFLIVLGAGIITIPSVATVGLSLLLGLAFVLSGLAQLIHAFRFIKSPGWAGRFLLAALALIAGIITLRNPIAGATGITLVLAFYLLLGAIAKATLAIEGGKTSGRNGLFFSSLISFCLGLYLLLTLPITSVVVPGIFLGVDLIFYGVSLTLASGDIRRGEQLTEPLEFRKVS